MPETRLDTLARRVLAARDDYEKKRKAKVKAEEKKADAELALYEAMRAASQESSGVLDLGKLGKWTFARRETKRARVIDRETAIAALKAEGKDDGYTVTEIRKAPLNELVKTLQENGEPLPDGIDFSVTRYVQATKKK